MSRSERKRLRGLYAITDASLQAPERLAARVAAVLEGGAALIQYRDKSADAARRLAQARELAALCRAQGALLIVNDDVELARAAGAHGVHLGRDDVAPAEARAQLGRDAIIGVSCYNEWDRAQRAAAAGADYIAFGRFFVSRTKPGAVQAETALLTRARRELSLPVAAIGGITADNGAALIEAGADLLAVVRDIFGRDDSRAAAERYRELFAGTRRSNRPAPDDKERTR